MSKAQHTAGEWAFKQSEAYPHMATLEVPYGTSLFRIEDARLMTAAPKLLRALEESLAAMERMDALLLKLTDSPHDCDKGEITRARAAIAQAKGE